MVGHDDYSRASRAAERSFVGRLSCLALGSLMTLGGCGGDTALGDYPDTTCELGEPPAGELRDVPINIATFWAEEPVEDMAFGLLKDFVDKDKYFVRTDEMPDRVATQRHIRDAFKNRRAPDLFQVNGGSDVLTWVESRQGEARDLCPLDSLREEYEWGNSYFPDALAPLSCDGSLYALPVGIHHLNVLFYNHRRFEELSELARSQGITLTPPAELESPRALVALLEQVTQLPIAGKPVVPLALASSDDWPLTIVAFENVLLGLGNTAYQTLWKGGLASAQGSAEGSEARSLAASLREMLAVLRDLKRYSNYDDHVEWQTAIDQVGSGEALFTIMGDWGFAQVDPVHSADVSTVTFPGTQGTFVYTPDSFAVPRDYGKNGFQPRAFLQEAAQDKSALIAFANAKHAIPPRIDLDEAELSALTSPGVRATYEEFSKCAEGVNGCQLLLAVSGLGPSPGIDPCLDEADAILAQAVADKPAVAVSNRSCERPMPVGAEEAEEHLLELWLEVARQRFAAGCR